MAGKRIEYAPDADNDLNRILRYIAEQSGLARAIAVAARLHKHTELIASRPHMGRPAPEVGPNARSLTVKPWLIYYRALPNDDGIRVVRVLDSRRDLRALFAKNP